jgi:hypothetical protein
MWSIWHSQVRLMTARVIQSAGSSNNAVAWMTRNWVRCFVGEESYRIFHDSGGYPASFGWFWGVVFLGRGHGRRSPWTTASVHLQVGHGLLWLHCESLTRICVWLLAWFQHCLLVKARCILNCPVTKVRRNVWLYDATAVSEQLFTIIVWSEGKIW